MWTRGLLKANAKQMFQRNYWECVVVSLLVGLLAAGGGGTGFSFNFNVNYNQDTYGQETGGISRIFDAHEEGLLIMAAGIIVLVAVIAIVGILLGVFVGNVLLLGGCNFYIRNRSEKPGIGAILSGFKSGHYGNIVLTLFLRDLFVGLWSLLFIIPGIIKSYEYMMVPYIMAENPGMERKEAFAISRRMMDGQKWDAFVLDLSFLGWEILSVFTCGILSIFYVSPYVHATHTELYTFNKIKAYNEGYIR